MAKSRTIVVTLLWVVGFLAAGSALAQQLKKLPDQPVGNAQQQESPGQTEPAVKSPESGAGQISPGAQRPTVRPDIFRMWASILEVVVLPFVPVTAMTVSGWCE